jgi:hypothetical protein
MARLWNTHFSKEHLKRVVSYAEPVVQDELTRADELSSWMMDALMAVLSTSCRFYFHEYFFVSSTSSGGGKHR